MVWIESIAAFNNLSCSLLMGPGPLWKRLAVDLAQRFDGIFGGAPLAAARV